MAHLRSTVQIQLEDGRILEGKRGLQLECFLKDLDGLSAPVVGAIVNGELRELTYPIEIDSRVRPITMANVDGMRIYRRSLTFLLATAFEEIFPETALVVDHSVASGGYYCHVLNHAPLTDEELTDLENRMKTIVEQNLPFSKSQLPVDEAIEYFNQKGFKDKVLLLAQRKKPYLIMYQLQEHRDYHHGYMVPSTGYLQWFALHPTPTGFTLRFPRRHKPVELLPPPAYPKMLKTFRQYGEWLEKLGVASIGALNAAIEGGRAREVILVSEALQERQIADIAAAIAQRLEEVRVVLIAGPSSSGKTTFAKRLSIQLQVLGLTPYAIGLDDFFVDREKTPHDEDGEYDYESLQALDRDRLSHDLAHLIAGEQVQLPCYDFLSGKQGQGEIVKLQSDQIIILEGIHGLNPELASDLRPESTFRIYASALTQLNLDRYNRVSTTDTRLIRRIVRDAQGRGYAALETISRWESVRRGEKRYIFPYQENADVMFNSALVYEGAAIAPQAEPLLRQVPFGTPEHVEAKRLLSFLDWFLPLDVELIPDNSILREFVGGSILKDFTFFQPPSI